MDIVVCVKHVPATDTRIKVGADGKSIDPADVNWILNPYDEYAVEEALKWKEGGNAESVTVVAVGNEECQKTLKHCLAMGADKAMLVNTGDASLDPYATSTLLHKAVESLEPGMIFTGKQGVGADNSLVPNMLAEKLGWPSATVVVKLEKNGDGLDCHREVEGGEEHISLAMPAVVSCQKGLNDPRYPSLKGIMAAKRKPVDTKTPEDLGVDLGAITGDNAHSKVSALAMPPERAEGKLIDGEPADQAKELVRLLREEAKAL